jgi:membrane protease YdiL (CAAX protease family)
MKNHLHKKDLKISLGFALIGLFAGGAAAMYQLSMFPESLRQQIVDQLGSLEALIPIAASQGALLTLVAAFFGQKIARKIQLNLGFRWDSKALTLALIIGFLTALIITGSDRFFFAPYLPEELINYTFSPIYFITGLLYGGVIEEVLFRLFVMSLLTLIIWKLSPSRKDPSLPGWIYWSGILLTAFLFAVGHLPFTSQAIGWSGPIIARGLLLNSIGGIGFGYLYWKKGLLYAIIAHAAAHFFMQLLFMPLFF